MMKPGEGSTALIALKRFSSLRDDLEFSEHDHIEYGIGKALADLANCRGINPARVAGLALEDNNHHSEAHILFGIADGTTTVRSFGDYSQEVMSLMVQHHDIDDPYASITPQYDPKGERLTSLYLAFLSNRHPTEAASSLSEVWKRGLTPA